MTTIDIAPNLLAPRRPTAFRRFAALLGAAIVGGVLLVAIFAPYLTPHDPFAQDLGLRLVPPAWMEGGQTAHLLGSMARAFRC
jgi:peptide/nickel transport system permease protein